MSEFLDQNENTTPEHDPANLEALENEEIDRLEPPTEKAAAPGAWTSPPADKQPDAAYGGHPGSGAPYSGYAQAPEYPPPQQQVYYNPYVQNQYQGQYPPAQNYRANPYQYSANNGWQQPRQPEQYQWNFADYEKAEQRPPKKKRSRGLVVFIVSLICVLSVGLVGVTAWGVVGYFSKGNGDTIVGGYESSSQADSASSNSVQMQIAGKPQINESLPISGKMSVPQIAAAVTPSVVGVARYQSNSIGETGYGSGIIMTADGYIITNAHVVSGGYAFKVILHDETAYDAELIGADEMTDIAVLKINAENLTPAVFGSSGDIEVGETVVAIGNPASPDLAGSVTQGIISAVNRVIPNERGNIKFIQTDAAINPGNSGGPLVNEYGQVIGINSSKIVANGYEGIGFSIPISDAKPIIDDIIENGRVTGRVILGISGLVIDEVDARNYGLQMGIRIQEINPDSDLANADVMRFDIITHINGERIYDKSGLQAVLANHKPGDTVTLTLYRSKVGSAKGDTFDVTTRLMEDK